MRKRVALALLAAAIVVGLVVAGRHELLRFAIESSAGLASGYTVSIRDQRIGLDQSALYDVHVSHAGQPLLDAARIDVSYSLRDMLPGSSHRFGLVGIDITNAKLTIVKLADGTYNFIIPGPGPASAPVPQRVDNVPLRFFLRMHDAGLELREPKAYDVSAKLVRIVNFNVDASVDSAAVTHYVAQGAFRSRQDRDEPFTIDGTIDSIRSFAMHRARAPRFPLRALANYFADTPAVRILRGSARNFDARLYSLDVRPNEAPSYHVNLQLDIAGGRMALSSIAAPIDDIVGHLQLVDNDFFLQRVDAKLAGIPLHVTGGIFDLLGSLTGAAQLRIGVYGSGDLHALRNAFTFTKTEPVSGNIDLGVLVEGPIDNPLIIAKGRAAHAIYRQMPFDSLEAAIVYHDNLVALAPLHAYYGGIDVGIRGTLAIGDKLHSLLSVHVEGTTDRLPYLDEMLAREPIVLDAAVRGDDLNFHALGVASSARSERRLAAILRLEPNGTAQIDPFWMHTERGNFEGGYALDRPHGDSRFWAVASGLQMHLPRYHTLPGIELPQLPHVNGSTIDAAAAGGGDLDNVDLAGTFASGKTEIETVHFDHLDASFAGKLTGAAINRMHARGPWGRFTGAGSFSTQAFVARGSYAGTFEGLQPFLGDAIPGHGALSGTASIAVLPNRIVVQGQDLAMRGATLRGIPVSRASLTLAVEGDTLHVYSAHARAAGGDVVAAGRFSVAQTPKAGAGALSLVADRLDAQQLRGLGLPLEGGSVWASGDLSAGAPIPSFAGGVTLKNGRLQQYALSGSSEVRLHGDRADLQQTLGSFGTTYAHVTGSIGNLSSGTPSYALRADVPAGNVATALHSLGFSNYMTQGSFQADLHLGGRGVAPDVSGRIAVPAGDVNGLPFLDGGADLRADTTGVSAQNGSVLVGTTRAQFSASTYPKLSELHVVAPHADLSDFNNFFDTGDTLDGDGSLKLAVSVGGDRIVTSGDVDVAHLRYRNLPIGNTRAYWSSARDAIDGSLAVNGSEGAMRANGSLTIEPRPDLFATVRDSRYNLAASMNGVDLSYWVPALGFTGVPISGRVSGEGTLRGRYPAIELRGTAMLDHGTLGPLALDTASVTVHSQRTRIAIDAAQLTTPGLQATATGSFGFRPLDPLDVQIHGTTDDLAGLTYQVARVQIPIKGSFESTLHVGGTYKRPEFVAGIDASNVDAYGIHIASLFGEAKLAGTTLDVSNAGATFAKGEMTLAGSVPLQLNPLRLGPDREPLNFDVDVNGLDPSVFDGVLGNNTKLGGTIDGHVGFSGSVGTPVIVGRATLTNGSYASDLEKTPILKTVAEFTFNRTVATIQRLSASVGTGTVGGSGRIEFPQGFESIEGYSFSFAGLAKGAQFDLPAYGSGTLDANLALTKAAGKHANLSGSATLTNATLAFSAFINAAQQSSAPSIAALPPIAFDLNATAGKNVRVRGNGYGAGLDIGAAGTVHLAGTLAAPSLSGSFTSTGGTLTYFDRAFRVQQGKVSFDPADGLLPTISAVATANIVNPDPDRARNPYGSAEITIDVNGPIQGLKFNLSSNPPGYSNDQIIAMLAPFGGFLGGIAFNNQSPYQVQSPGGFTPLGALQPIPNLYTQRNSSITVGQEAFNILNAQFAAGILSPVENALGSGLGLSSVNLTLGYYGNVGVTATRMLGKTVSAVYATTFGLPQVQSFGLKVNPSENTSATLSFFYQTGPQRIYETPGYAVGYGGNGTVLTEPLLGQSGFSFMLNRYL